MRVGFINANVGLSKIGLISVNGNLAYSEYANDTLDFNLANPNIINRIVSPNVTVNSTGQELRRHISIINPFANNPNPANGGWQQVAITFTMPSNPNNNPLGNTTAPYLVFETLLNNQNQIIMLDDVVLEEIISTAPITITKAANGLVNNNINNPITASIGSVVSYTITVTTNGAACGTNITNLNLIDTVPVGLQYISATGLTPTTSISATGIATTVLTANIPSIQPYSTLTFSYAAVVVGTNANQCQGNANLIIPNTATVSANFNNSVVTASSTVRIRINQPNTNNCDVAPITLDFSQAIAQGLLRSAQQ